MKHKTSKVLRYSLLLLALSLFFLAFNTISAMLPNAPIREHIQQDVPYYKTIGDYDRPILNERPHTFDYFTDALILNVALSTNNSHPIEAALLNVYHDKLDMTKTSRWDYLQHIQAKQAYPTEYNSNYPRYWFGNAYLYRYFFLFSNYSSLRLMLYLVTSLLLFAFLIRQYRLTNWPTVLSFLLGLLMVNLMYMQYLIQFSSVLIVSLSIALAVQHWHAITNKDMGTLFLLSGALTVYFDLLTAPILSLGLPLLVWISLQQTHNAQHAKQQLLKIITFGLLWAFAYFGLFIIKWIWVALLTDMDIVANVKGQALTRIGITSDHSFIESFYVNINAINLVLLSILLIASTVYSAIRFSTAAAYQAILYCFAAFVPFVWIALINEHSFSHFWFAYRMMAISITALFLAIFSFRKTNNNIDKP